MKNDGCKITLNNKNCYMDKYMFMIWHIPYANLEQDKHNFVYKAKFLCKSKLMVIEWK